MEDDLARGRLARAALRLNGRARCPRLPALVLLTDDARLPDPLGAARALPRGSLVILRARDAVRRRALALALARARGVVWIVAGDPELASHSGASGVHFPEAQARLCAHWRARRPGWLITCAAHSLAACARATGADAVLLGPVFPTASHPVRASLGPLRARFIAGLSPVAVYALGGIDAHTSRRLEGAHLAGLAAIGGLAG